MKEQLFSHEHSSWHHFLLSPVTLTTARPTLSEKEPWDYDWIVRFLLSMASHAIDWLVWRRKKRKVNSSSQNKIQIKGNLFLFLFTILYSICNKYYWGSSTVGHLPYQKVLPTSLPHDKIYWYLLFTPLDSVDSFGSCHIRVRGFCRASGFGTSRMC